MSISIDGNEAMALLTGSIICFVPRWPVCQLQRMCSLFDTDVYGKTVGIGQGLRRYKMGFPRPKLTHFFATTDPCVQMATLILAIYKYLNLPNSINMAK